MGHWAWEQGLCTGSSVQPLPWAQPVARTRDAPLTAPPAPPRPCPLAAHPCLTCRHEEDASTQDDVVACLVELACRDAEATHEEQDHAQDREDTRGPHGPCGT